MEQDSKKTKLIIVFIIALVLVLAAGVYYFYFMPKEAGQQIKITASNDLELQVPEPLSVHLPPPYVKQYVVSIKQNLVRDLSNGAKQYVITYVADQPPQKIHDYFKSFFDAAKFKIAADNLKAENFNLVTAVAPEQYNIVAFKDSSAANHTVVTISLVESSK